MEKKKERKKEEKLAAEKTIEEIEEQAAEEEKEKRTEEEKEEGVETFLETVRAPITPTLPTEEALPIGAAEARPPEDLEEVLSKIPAAKTRTEREKEEEEKKERVSYEPMYGKGIYEETREREAGIEISPEKAIAELRERGAFVQPQIFKPFRELPSAHMEKMEREERVEAKEPIMKYAERVVEREELPFAKREKRRRIDIRKYEE